jgi:hypothetical protein
MNRRAVSKRIGILLAPALIALALSACVSAHPVILADRTLPPVTQAPAPSSTPEPTPSPTPEPTATPAPAFDAKGNYISGLDHYKQYLSFRNVQVYEQENDTFVDAIILNEYPETIVCAAGVAFYDENGELVAEGRFQTRDAQYILILPPGETTLFAQVDTDMMLTNLDLSILFDDSLGVKPEE